MRLSRLPPKKVSKQSAGRKDQATARCVGLLAHQPSGKLKPQFFSQWASPRPVMVFSLPPCTQEGRTLTRAVW